MKKPCEICGETDHRAADCPDLPEIESDCRIKFHKAAMEGKATKNEHVRD